ncbi:zinc-binding alcohol dehydrogenase [Bacillus sp. M6-12]|uniref:zinc-binding dehydrogenase n=1 Tax=Bacillus sp. M6-12 TaxID=2054166 RepID=UPI000C760CCC|nr:zinc-binding dehydrogenase [Bacillus sp. M6-12]PLS14596.1 zinc-binding alcohol dehydrogenase [Bacillus sp. M6-12]
MKAYLLSKSGSSNNLFLGDVAIPEPQKGEIRVQVKAVALNPVDYQLLESGHSKWAYPFILGLDVAGDIDKLGEEVADFKLGDRVVYHGDLSRNGGYAEYTLASAKAVSKIPEEISYIEAAALPCSGMTAFQALNRKFHHYSVKTLLVHGGSGAVGGAVIQLAKLKKWEIISTCSTQNVDYVKSLGADYVIDYKKQNVTKEVLSRTAGRGVDVVINTIRKDHAENDINHLAFNGHLVCIAGLASNQTYSPFTKGISIHEVALGGAYLAEDNRSITDFPIMLDHLLNLVKDKKFDPMISKVISLNELVKYLEKIKEHQVRGKIIVTI